MEHRQLQGELQRALYRLGRAHLDEQADPLTPMEAFTLGLIRHLHAQSAEGEGIRVSQLARACRVSSPAISRALRHLEDKGLVRRVTLPNDRRATCVELTEHGEAALEQHLTQSQSLMRRVLERMGEDNVLTLIRQLDLLTDLILEEREQRLRQTQIP